MTEQSAPAGAPAANAKRAISSALGAPAANAACAASAAPAAPFTPLLTTTDWSAEWKQLQAARHAADDAAYWNERAKTFSCGDETSPYARRFLELAGIREGETVFDMGCGTGALALPLGRAGHRVIAADFSEGMLGVLDAACRRNGVTSVETKQMSWEDDWEEHGIGENCVDVATASRSIATADLRDSLTRLTRVARRHACITLAAGSSPRSDERILSAIGLQNQLGRDFIYAFMILVGMGFRPEVSYILSERLDTYDTQSEAFDNLAKMVRSTAGTVASEGAVAQALASLDVWLDDNLIENEHAGEPDDADGVQKQLRLRKPRVITWAFIAWDTAAH